MWVLGYVKACRRRFRIDLKISVKQSRLTDGAVRMIGTMPKQRILAQQSFERRVFDVHHTTYAVATNNVAENTVRHAPLIWRGGDYCENPLCY